MISILGLKNSMLINEITRWVFTNTRFRETNPFSRFEVEMLDAFDQVEARIDSDERLRIRKLVLERTQEIFESDLSWGQNIYSRENLRWVSFIAGYDLVVRENIEDHQPFLRSLEERIQTVSRIRFYFLWFLVAWTIICVRRTLPNKYIVRRLRLSKFVATTYLPFTTSANWTNGHDAFYQRFFTAHACPELCRVLDETSVCWKKLVLKSGMH